ncbi:MAG TPA: Wzz/FepE/Etk N-terminal domain-containing protein, partial [Acinetobacter sp.]|nr:Wzz/FepE/Etk N-terminal domain-containing protein [Acinetobacter sp.]
MSQNTNTEDTINLKELFFSLIAQWKLIALCIMLSLACALLYLRVTPDTFAVDALVQVEDSKGASAALLGDLSQMIDQKSPAQSEIEILKSRLVLGSVIRALHLDLNISSEEDTFNHRLLHQTNYKTRYSTQSVLFHDNQKTFNIRKFDIPNDYLNKNLSLSFQNQQFKLIDLDTEEILLTGPLNQISQFSNQYGAWNVGIFTKDSFQTHYLIQKKSLPAAVKALSAKYSVAEKGKLTGILGLSYQGQDKE